VTSVPNGSSKTVRPYWSAKAAINAYGMTSMTGLLEN
jgi:hypothetical protein